MILIVSLSAQFNGLNILLHLIFAQNTSDLVGLHFFVQLQNDFCFVMLQICTVVQHFQNREHDGSGKDQLKCTDDPLSSEPINVFCI